MKIELPENKKFIFEMIIPIRWGDMDAMGHVNNANYFRYLETVRVEWMHSIDCEPSILNRKQGPVILNAFCNFYRQLEYPGDVLARFYVSDAARATFETWTTLSRTDQPDVIYAAGGATTVWIDYELQKAVDLPDELRRIINN